jgi:hypothetical protein
MHIAESDMPATERIVILVPKTEKNRIAKRAKALNLSVAEYLRKAELAYDPEDAELLQELAVRAAAAMDHIETTVSDVVAFISESNRRMDEIDRATAASRGVR